jgi:hypothetical protein
MARHSRLIIGIAVVALLAGYLWLTQGAGHTVAEWALGESPQARLRAYVAAVDRGDREAAMALWRSEGLPGCAERRQQVTGELLAMGPGLEYRVTGVSWWAAWCCDGGEVEDPSLANVVRLHVEIGSPQSPARQCVFEVRARTFLGPQAPGEQRVRLWSLADVFPAESAIPRPAVRSD